MINHWRARVLEAIKAGDQNYLRPPTYDHVLGALLLAMATRLAKRFGRAPFEENPMSIFTKAGVAGQIKATHLDVTALRLVDTVRRDYIKSL